MKFKLKNKDKNKSGIYLITCEVNNKKYVGSAFNFYDRFRTHKSRLENNKHSNKHLQHAFNKYGCNEFSFSLLEEVVDLNEIYIIENKYLTEYHDFGVTCYNINTDTKPEESLRIFNEKRLKIFKLVSPENEIFEFKGITNAAKEINIKGVNIKTVVSGLHHVLSGKVKSYKGWRLIENYDYDFKNYRKKNGKGAKRHVISLLSPTGEVYSNIFNIEEFSREHGVKSSIIHNIIKGRTRYSNGWSLFNGDKTPPPTKNSKKVLKTLIDPLGVEYSDIVNLNKFCREHDLNQSSIRNLINGKIKKGVYKGWKIK